MEQQLVDPWCAGVLWGCVGRRTQTINITCCLCATILPGLWPHNWVRVEGLACVFLCLPQVGVRLEGGVGGAALSFCGVLVF